MTTTPEVPVKKATVKTAAKKTTIQEVKEIINPSPVSRIKRLELFQKIADRHTKLLEKKDELDSFNVGTDGLNEKLVLHCGDLCFEISNSQVIAKLKLGIEDKLLDLIEQSGNEIVSYHI